MARAVIYQIDTYAPLATAGVAPCGRAAVWCPPAPCGLPDCRRRLHTTAPSAARRSSDVGRRSCWTWGSGRGQGCRAGAAVRSGGRRSPCRWPMTCATTPTCVRCWVPIRSAGPRSWPSLGRGPATPSTVPAEAVDPPMSAWPPIPATRCAPCSAPTPHYGCWGWPPKCCAAGNAPEPNA